MFKKMQDFGGKVQEMNDRCREVHVQGSAGGGLVQVEANALSEILDCTIDPGVFSQGDNEFLEDLIITAVNNAMQEAKHKHAEMMQSVAGSMDLPNIDGLQDILGKLGMK